MHNSIWICDNGCYSNSQSFGGSCTPEASGTRSRTREIVRNLQPADVEERVDAARIQALLSAGALVEEAYSLTEYWGGKRKTALLAMPATRHSLTHLNHARLVRKKLGQGGTMR
jgi:hypothetical protein